MMSCTVQKHEGPLGWRRQQRISFSSGYVSTIRRRGTSNTFTVLASLLYFNPPPSSPSFLPPLSLLSPSFLPPLSLLSPSSLPPLSLARLILASTAIRRWCVGGLRAVIDLPVCQPTDMPSAQHQIIHSCPQFGLKIIRSYSFFGFTCFHAPACFSQCS